MNIVEEVESLLAPLLAEAKTELVDVEWRGEPSGWVLRILLDKPGGVGVEECAEWSRVVDERLDASGLMSRRYSLEVSSPGPDRPLKKAGDFEKFLGRGAVIKTSVPLNNQRNFRGVLTGLRDGEVELTDRTSGPVRIPLANILRARLDPDQ